ncbi:MAG TPA: three-Cys-motif partner protein TcmP [Opitutaceae bacterium]|nr:three-Cys-motif partner protein TcmP [Opitutaceae bacterium]
MASDHFHNEPFDEGTLTKLDIFQLYTREWLPVFLSREVDYLREVHLFDFFAGPGTDANGEPGSPLRTLAALREYSTHPNLHAWGKVPVTAHFSESTLWKAKKLKAIVESEKWRIPGVNTRTTRADFAGAFAEAESILQARDAAKLLLLDQFGVSEVTREVFLKLVSYPRTDFLFFISSATLQRFREHPNIRHKIRRADDFNQVHHAVLNYYREMLPPAKRYYLAPFSIKKGSNIYGIIFGSAHPLGMDKFLTVAWEKDGLNGNANFDINRDALAAGEFMLDLGPTTRPLKINVFEEELEAALRQKKLRDEIGVMELCYRHGVMRKHARPVLQRLHKEGIIQIAFQIPNLDYLKTPRLIRYP